MAMSPRLTRAMHQQLGDELSKELFTWMVQMESSRSELTELHSDFLKFVVQTNRRFDGVEARFERFETRVEARFDRQDEKFDKLTALLDKRHQDLMKWLFICWCGSVFAIVALVLAAR